MDVHRWDTVLCSDGRTHQTFRQKEIKKCAHSWGCSYFLKIYLMHSKKFKAKDGFKNKKKKKIWIIVPLHFRIFHLWDYICGFCLAVFEIRRPHVIHPVHLIHLERKTELLDNKASHLSCGLEQNHPIQSVTCDNTTVGRLMRFSSLVWLNSKLMTLKSLSRSSSGVS